MFGHHHGFGFGHGGRMAAHGGRPRQGHGARGARCGGEARCRPDWDGPAPDAMRLAQATVPGEGVCPLCDKHCPLAAPSCGKGRRYAAKMGGGA